MRGYDKQEFLKSLDFWGYKDIGTTSLGKKIMRKTVTFDLIVDDYEITDFEIEQALVSAYHSSCYQNVPREDMKGNVTITYTPPPEEKEG